MTRDFRQNRGFTLIELMVVVAIILILSALFMSVASQTYGANARSVSDQISVFLNTCKMRAVSSRKWQRCTISPQSFGVSQWTQVGMTAPPSAASFCSPSGPPPDCYQYVQGSTIGNPIKVWDAQSTICTTSPCAGAPSAVNTALQFNIDFRPDGSSTGGTIFITDPGKYKQYRVVVYKSTGTAYPMQGW